MFRKMPYFLLGLIALITLVDPYLPLLIKSLLFSISLTIKSLIIFVLPAIIFSLIFKVMHQLSRQAMHIVFLILAFVSCSNYLSTFLSHFVGSFIYQFEFSVLTPTLKENLMPLWQFHFPHWIDNDTALLAGLILSFLVSFFSPSLAALLASKLEWGVSKVLRGVIYIIPLFVAGFSVKMAHEGVMSHILKEYAFIFLIIGISQFAYILLLYFICNPSWSSFINKIRNMLPAVIAGFSTMSSAAAMPLTIIATEKNVHDPVLGRSLIPATVNIHLIGDCFAIPILAYAILKSFGLPAPAMVDYLIFAGFFVLAKFSVAGVPGGGIIVMLPILESYLGFNAQMLSLITALYILFDPVITSANVFGNGAFALIVDKLQSSMKKRHRSVINNKLV